jgi:hypothetical protein
LAPTGKSTIVSALVLHTALLTPDGLAPLLSPAQRQRLPRGGTGRGPPAAFNLDCDPPAVRPGAGDREFLRPKRERKGGRQTGLKPVIYKELRPNASG